MIVSHRDRAVQMAVSVPSVAVDELWAAVHSASAANVAAAAGRLRMTALRQSVAATDVSLMEDLKAAAISLLSNATNALVVIGVIIAVHAVS